MKYLFAAVVILIGVAACTVGSTDSGIHLTHARADLATCDFSDDTKYKESGSLDLSGTALSYGQVFAWENTLQAATIKVGADTLTDTSQQSFFANQAQLSFQVNGTTPFSIPNATENIAAFIAPGALATQNAISLDVLPPAAMSVIIPKIQGTNNSVEILTTLKVVGRIAQGSASTNSLTFPVTVYDSRHACAAGTTPGGGSCWQSFGSGRDTSVNGCYFPDGGLAP